MLGICILIACSPKISHHGIVLKKDFKKILSNKNISKPEIMQILGTPSIEGTFSENTWYYITQKNEEFAYHDVKKVDHLVIKIRFDKNDKIKYVRTYNAGDGRNIKITKNETPAVQGSTYNLFRQLIGNLGKYNPPQ